MADYTGLTNKFGNAVGIPFSSFSTEEDGVIDLAYAADDLTRQNDMFWLDGIRQDSVNWADGDGAVRWSNGFNVYVRPFRAAVNGTIVYAPQISLTFDPETVSERVDSVVIHRDYIARTVNVMILKGTSGSTEPPALTRNAYGIYEYELARVHISNTMDSLSQTDIADMRTALVADFGVRPTSADAGKSISVGLVGELVIDGPKVDTSAYVPYSIKAHARVNADSTVLDGENVTTVSLSAGVYTVYSPAITLKSRVFVDLLYGPNGGVSVMMGNIDTPGQVPVLVYTAAWARTTAPFSIAII